MRSRDVELLWRGALCAVAFSMSAGGCQPEGNSSLPTGPGGPGGTTSGAGAGASAGEGGSGGEAGTGSAGGGGGAEDPPAQVVTIEEITTEIVPRDTVVELKGVVAMSPKFFIDDTKSGDCLWGVFLSSPGLDKTAANSGILAVSRSKAATDGNGEPVCPSLEDASAGDPFPDDVAPGDVLDVAGETTYFSSSSCRDACGDLTCDSASEPPENASNCRQDCSTSPELIPQSATGQFQIEWIKSAVRTGRVEVPEPHVLTADEMVKLSSPTETEFHHAWGGVKVRLEGSLSPVLRTDTMGEQTVAGAYGNIHLKSGPEGGLVQVGNKAYYIGGAESACHEGPVYSNVNVVFNRVDGFIYNNFCIWSLQLANKCTDIDPPSEDCIAEELMCP